MSRLLSWLFGEEEWVMSFCLQFRGSTPTAKPLFEVNSEALMATPPWEEDDANPPLSVREGLRLGHQKLRDLVECEREWELVGVELVEVEEKRWFYRLHFQLLRDREGNYIVIMGKPYYLPILVLMNGTALDPVGEHDLCHLPIEDSPYHFRYKKRRSKDVENCQSRDK